jgi:adenosylcobinamide-GDP ribazoletransferase
VRQFPIAILSPEGARLAPLAGALIGAIGGVVYWLAAHLWPSSVALMVAMAVTALLTEIRNSLPATRRGLLTRLFCLLIKYNALMALSAAKLPFAVPANLELGLIMICGHAASYALAVSSKAIRIDKPTAKRSGTDLSLALLIGFAPAALLGIPGLVGLAAAIGASLGFLAYLKIGRAAARGDILDLTRLFAEVCFYLGALAARSYI